MFNHCAWQNITYRNIFVSLITKYVLFTLYNMSVLIFPMISSKDKI